MLLGICNRIKKVKNQCESLSVELQHTRRYQELKMSLLVFIFKPKGNLFVVTLYINFISFRYFVKVYPVAFLSTFKVLHNHDNGLQINKKCSNKSALIDKQSLGIF